MAPHTTAVTVYAASLDALPSTAAWLHINQPPPGTETCSFRPWILGDSYLMEGGTENLTLPASKVHGPREGPRDLEGRTLGVGWSISASWDPEWVGKKQKETSPASVFLWAEGAMTGEEPRARLAGALRKGAGARLSGGREG